MKLINTSTIHPFTNLHRNYPRLLSEMEKPVVSAIIPCLNEEETLGICINKIKQTFESLNINGEIVVGDNGSTDRSVEIAESLGAVVAHQPIKGYGAAIQAAVKKASSDWLIMADADDSYDWTNLKPFLDELEKGSDLVMGNRFQGTIHPGAMPFLHKYVGNPFLTRISQLLYKIKVGDFHCGMRGFTREAWNKMHLMSPGMEFATEMVIRASEEKLAISEIPIDLHPDKRSRPPHLQTFRDGWRHLRFIMTYAPNYLYLIPGLLMVFIGLIFQIVLFNGPVTIYGQYIGIHFLALGLMIFFLGLSVTTMGITARVYLVNKSRLRTDPVTHWVNNHFYLEKILLSALLLFIAGLAIDISILFRWLEGSDSMETSIHYAFIASSMIVTSIHLSFSSFFLDMFRKKDHE